MAVCERNFKLLTGETYGHNFIGIAPAEELPGKLWDCATGSIRDIAETKGGQHQDKCSPDGACC